MATPRAPGSPSGGHSAAVTLSAPMSPWDGGAEGWPITSGEQVVWCACSPVTRGAYDVTCEPSSGHTRDGQAFYELIVSLGLRWRGERWWRSEREATVGMCVSGIVNLSNRCEVWHIRHMNAPAVDHRDMPHRFPAELSSPGVGWYVRCCLSARDVEALLSRRLVMVSAPTS
jgi:hypothetical protein